ncbi:MAG: universal stress protein [Acetobacteraceae bacterium]|nr:universal stress protein [Acetobacteraceae bacterium]
MKIVVPVDGSTAANHAVAFALLLARGRPDTEVVLLNVQSRETLEVSDIAAVISAGADREIAGRQSKKALRRPVVLCREAVVKFETRAELGPIAETIVRIAHHLKADQIVMGTRGLGALRGLFLGSVTTKVVQLARMPVTLVK